MIDSIYVPVLDGDRVQQVALAAEVVREARGLFEAHEIYFEGVEDCERVPLGSLIWSRLRPNGVAAAVSIMRRCAQNVRRPREPVSVVSLGDGRSIIFDGNSTAAVCLAAQWKSLPIRRLSAAQASWQSN
jgi:hypothetical protein